MLEDPASDPPGEAAPVIGRVIGRVVALWRYPVKSMAPEPLDRVPVAWNGLAGDRRWAFVRDGQTRSGFPWLTIRERSDLVLHQPRITDPDQPDTSAVRVRTPSGAEHEIDDPALAAALEARVMKQDRGIFDTMPISLLSTQSVAALGALVGAELDPQRFRPNLYVEAASGEPFAEDTWVGRILRIGGLRMRIDKRDQRCVVVNVDPTSTEKDPAILRAIGRERDARLGVYGTTVEPGTVAVGDEVLLEP